MAAVVAAAAPVNAMASPGDVFCVDADVTTGVSVEELVRALQARLPARVVTVTACAQAQPDAIRWRLTVAPQRPGDLVLQLEGVGVAEARPLERRGLDPQQLTQVVALVAAEVVQPRLELVHEPSPIVVHGAAGEEEVRRQPLAVARPPGLDASLQPALLTRPWQLAPSARIGTGVTSGQLGLTLDALVSPLWPAKPGAPEVRGWMTDLRLAGAWHVWRVTVRAGIQSRVLRVAHRPEMSGDSRWDTVWTGGFSVGAAVPVLQAGQVTLALAADLSLWPQPPRLFIRGAPALALPQVELAAGPVLQWSSAACDLQGSASGGQ